MKHPFIKVTVLNLLLAVTIPTIAEETSPEPVPSGFPSKGERINARLDRLDNKGDRIERRMDRRGDRMERRTERVQRRSQR